MIRRLRFPGSRAASERTQAEADRIEPPRPLSEMTEQEMADWARDDPVRARRFIRQQERAIRQRQRQSRRPAVVDAFYGSCLLMVVGIAAYMNVRGFSLFDKPTWGQNLAIVGIFLVVWLLVWALIAVWRRRVDRRG